MTTIRKALEDIITAANANPEPIHYKVREAIQKGKESLAASVEPRELRFPIIGRCGFCGAIRSGSTTIQPHKPDCSRSPAVEAR